MGARQTKEDSPEEALGGEVRVEVKGSGEGVDGGAGAVGADGVDLGRTLSMTLSVAKCEAALAL